MKKRIIKFLPVLLSLLLTFTAIPTVNITAQDNLVKYEIYPTPQSIEYYSDDIVVTPTVDVNFGADIDQPTKNHLFSALSNINVYADCSNGVSNNTKVLLGVYQSGDNADRFLRLKTQIPTFLFESMLKTN